MAPPLPPPLVEWRCPHCRNLVLVARLAPGSWLQTVCPKCRTLIEKGERIQQAA